MKRLGLFLIILYFGFCPTFGFSFNNQSDVSKIINSFKIQNDAPGKLVRVGIGNQNFSNYLWERVSIYATGEYEI
ncbi:hypothetical protein J6N69_06550, partial [bacterium]|nr:hypothetical protein [bacterium]